MAYLFTQALPLVAKTGKGVAIQELPLHLAAIKWAEANPDLFCANPKHDLVIVHELVHEGHRPDVAVFRADIELFRVWDEHNITPVLQRTPLRFLQMCMRLHGAEIRPKMFENFDPMSPHRRKPVDLLVDIFRGRMDELPRERKMQILQARRRAYYPTQNASSNLSYLSRTGHLVRVGRGVYKVNPVYQAAVSGIWNIEAKVGLSGLQRQMIRHAMYANGGWMIVPVRLGEKLKRQTQNQRYAGRLRAYTEHREYNPVLAAGGVLVLHTNGVVQEILEPLFNRQMSPVDRLSYEQALYARYLLEKEYLES